MKRLSFLAPLGLALLLAIGAARDSHAVGIFLSDGAICGFHSNTYATDEIIYVCGDWDQPDGICATGDVYITVDDGRTYTVGRLLHDDMGSRNAIQACVGAGEFFDEIIALPPLLVGRYDVVMDENQNGIFTGGLFPDYVLGDGGSFAFEVLDFTLGTGINSQVIKDAALYNALHWALSGRVFNRTFNLAFDKLPSPTKSAGLSTPTSANKDDLYIVVGVLRNDRDIAYEAVVRYLNHRPTQPEFELSVKPLKTYKSYLKQGLYVLDLTMYNQVQMYFDLYNDPPDPNYTEQVRLPALALAPRGGPGTDDRLLLRLTNLLQEQLLFGPAVRRSYEKFQGAAAGPNNYWTKMQNTSLLEYAMLFKSSVDAAVATVNALQTHLDGLDVVYAPADSAKLSELQDRLATDGLTTAELDIMTANGFLPAEIDSLTASIMANDYSGMHGLTVDAGFDDVKVMLGAVSVGLDSMIQSSQRMVNRLTNVWIDHPTARITGSASAPEGNPVALSGSTSSDPQGGALSYAWDLDADSVFDDATGAMVSPTFDLEGIRLIGLEVTDGQAYKDVAYTRLDITDVNDGPAVIASSPDSAFVPFVGSGSIAFSVTAEDPEQDPITYQWFIDGTAVGATTSSFNWMVTPGIHTIEVLLSDNSPWSPDNRQVWRVRTQDPVDVADQPMTQAVARLDLAQPNPFEQSTSVRLTLPASLRARIAIFDVAGRRVKTLVEGELAAGVHEITWDGRDAAGRPAARGVYYLAFDGGGRVEQRRLTLIR